MNNLKILLADDHEGFRRMVATFLSTQAGVEVVGEARDGNEAVEQAERHRPDLVLIDISMPNLNGLEAAKAIKSRLPMTRVIILSLNGGEMYRRMARQSSADYFIDKGSMKSALLAIVSGVLTGITTNVAEVHAA